MVPAGLGPVALLRQGQPHPLLEPQRGGGGAGGRLRAGLVDAVELRRVVVPAQSGSHRQRQFRRPRLSLLSDGRPTAGELATREIIILYIR